MEKIALRYTTAINKCDITHFNSAYTNKDRFHKIFSFGSRLIDQAINLVLRQTIPSIETPSYIRDRYQF